MKGRVTRFGYDVKTAASAEEADHWLSSMRFHAVLLVDRNDLSGAY